MSGPLPIEESEDTLNLSFSDAPRLRSIEIEGVLDLTHFREAVGLEILDLRRQLGGTEPERLSPDRLRWSYDAEIDAFYVHVHGDYAPVQRKVRVLAFLDQRGRLVGLEIPLGDYPG